MTIRLLIDAALAIANPIAANGGLEVVRGC
jgi:hypothetical protein